MVHGRLQYEKAVELYDGASAPVHGSVDFRHSYVDFNSISQIDPDYVLPYVMPWDEDALAARTGIGCVGGGFLAGDEDGAPVDFAAEGDIKHSYEYQNGDWIKQQYSMTDLDGIASLLGVFWPFVKGIINTDMYGEIQKEKFVLLPVGKVDDFYFPNPDTPFVPHIVPIQLLTVGQLAIVATSFELTTMMARRLKATLKDTLAQIGITDIVIGAIANSYGQYMTTREEYAAQHFEGAFNLYGPWSGAALMQENHRLAMNLVDGVDSEPGPVPPDLSDEQFVETSVSTSGVVNDDGDFGAVIQDVNPSYSNGETAVARFEGAHPRTVLVLKSKGTLGNYYKVDRFTFLEVQKKDTASDQWVTVATDRDETTRFRWKRVGGQLSARSEVTLEWTIKDAEPGTYRLVYNGLAKNLIAPIQKFTGTSGEMTVH